MSALPSHSKIDSNHRTSLIVGGSKGIGAAITECLGARSHAVSVISRDRPRCQLPAVRYYATDVVDWNASAEVIDEIAVNGLNHLVLVQRYRGDGDSWEGEFDVSVQASRRIVERLADRFALPASIVFISSVNATLITPTLPLSYHVAKAAVNQMVRYFAVCLGPKGVRVNSVSPSSVIKAETEGHYARSPARPVFEGVVPLGRMATATDVATVVAFLCSDDSAFVTGQDLVVDGGASLIWQESLALRLRDKPDA